MPIEKWALTVNLTVGRFSFSNHEFQKGILMDRSQRKVFKKGSQLGISETQILVTIYGLLHGLYPQGALYLFPSEKDVYDFSRARFNPLLVENPSIGKEVQQTESVTLKKVRKSMLYLRGARATSAIEGMKKMATQLLSIPVDRVCFDERDSMSDDMVELALTRLGHSSVKEEVYLGTPSLPDYGVSKLYDESDQRVWEIKCAACSAGTVLELEFPACIIENGPGHWIRACKKCSREIFPKDGRWVTRFPQRSEDMAGYWISRLNSSFADLKGIAEKYLNPQTRNKQEFYNSTLAMGYVESENRLSMAGVYECCGQDAMLMRHEGPCAMGVDVGRELHVVIGFKPSDKQLRICHTTRVTSFNDLHDLAGRFNVKCCVLDLEPEMRKVREFAAAEHFMVFGADYQDSTVGTVWDEFKKVVRINRTEACDASHDLVTGGLLSIPRKNEEIETFARQVTNTAKVLQEDPINGSRTYVYRKLGPDHYRHALNYFNLAAGRIGVYEANSPEARLRKMLQSQQEDYNPLTFGLPIQHI
jgi:hypothetical protein